MDVKNDTISRQAAITALMEDAPEVWTDSDYELGMMNQHKYDVNVIKALPSAEPKLSPEVQDILDYLDTVLHPIVSPERWDVYADLHDMVSMLPSTQPRKGEWVEIQDDIFAPIVVCSNCGQRAMVEDGEYQRTRYCPNCGFQNGGK